MHTADRFCDLAGFHPDRLEPVVYAHDGSCCTLIEVDGTRTIVSDEEFEEAAILRIAGSLAQILKRPGHNLSISFESSLNTHADIETLATAQLRSADQKGLSLEAIVEEGRVVLERRARRERILVAVWTRPDAAISEELAEEIRETRALWRSLPPANEAQNPFLKLDALEGPHAAFVKRVVEALTDARLQVRVLGPEDDGSRRDLAEIRRAILFHETPTVWRPFGPGTRAHPAAKERIDDDVGAFFAPTVARQIMTANAEASSDLRTIAVGGRRYALAVMRMFPATILAFDRLLEALLQRSSRSADLPFRVCLHIEAPNDGGMTMKLRKVAAGLIAWASPSNRNLFESLRTLEEIIGRDSEAIVKCRLTACTWVEPGEEPGRLDQRRSTLKNALMTWGDALIADAPHNPLRALCETIAGMNYRASIAPASLAPLGDLAVMFPFHRTAEIFRQGQTMLLNPDGRMMPYEALSPEQLFWLTLIFATPGSGKSVLMNRLNVEFAAFQPSRVLPFLGVIDVGVSSSGLIELIRNALPPERRHEAYYVRLLNDHAHAINPLVLRLGRRRPLPRERVFVENFLATLLDLKQDGSEQLISRLGTRLYQLKSDLEFGSSPAIYQPGIDAEVDRAIHDAAIGVGERTRWWRIVDEFVALGRILPAMRAQRYAEPILEDLARVLGERIMTEDFGETLVKSAQRALESAIERFPVFARPTRLDLGEARVIAIDLNDVALRHKAPDAERNNALMFMISRHAFLSKISGHAEEIGSMDLPTEPDVRAKYVAFWENRYAEIAETPKRLCMDEYHLTGGVATIAKQVLSDVREGRKWGLEVILASQLLADFEVLADMASTVMILNADSNELREAARKTFGFSDAVKRALERQVHGPRGSRGANFLARFKLRDEERWVVLNNSLGPRMLWALTTRAEDRQVRDELYRRMDVNEALRVLAARFPEGTAHDTWKKVAGRHHDADDRIAAMLADEIVAQIMRGEIRT